MARSAPSPAPVTIDKGYRVELPRTCDAMGAVLRDAYGPGLCLPDDMVMLLRRLSGRPATSRDA